MPLEQIYINCRLEDFPFELNKIMRQICEARLATSADEEKITKLDNQIDELNDKLKAEAVKLAYEIDQRLSTEAALAEAQKEIDEYAQADELENSKTVVDLQTRIEDLEFQIEELKDRIRESHPAVSDAVLFD